MTATIKLSTWKEFRQLKLSNAYHHQFYLTFAHQSRSITHHMIFNYTKGISNAHDYSPRVTEQSLEHISGDFYQTSSSNHQKQKRIKITKQKKFYLPGNQGRECLKA